MLWSHRYELILGTSIQGCRSVVVLLEVEFTLEYLQQALSYEIFLLLAHKSVQNTYF